jgi:oligopeptide transport system ATP-binding protein
LVTDLLEVRDLTTRFYTSEGVVHAVNGISYTLGQGEALGIVGESGCGKSVSVLSVLGLIPEPPGKITAGQVLYRGQDLLKLDRTEMQRIRGNEIAMVFQDPMTSLNPVLTIGHQISESLSVHLGMNKEEARERAVELLDMVGIPRPADRYSSYPHQFSGGMRQRAMIAMALACEPDIFIADEPTTALDVTIQAQIVDLVKSLRDGSDLDHPRPGRRRGDGGEADRDVRGLHRRAGTHRRHLRRSPPSVYTVAAEIHTAGGPLCR